MNIQIEISVQPKLKEKEAIVKLWNEEYPIKLQFENMEGLENYLNSLLKPQHLFALMDTQIVGWAFSFEREGERWFAIIVSSAQHKKGIGRGLLNELKKKENVLNGWVIDKEEYVKFNGENYTSPLHFYLKNKFEIVPEIRLETEKLSALKIVWKKQSKQ